MTNEEILANAPEGATHYGEGVYFKANAVGRKFLEYSSWNGKGKPEWWLNRVSSEMQSLSDIRRIVELESELDKAYNDLANFEGYPEEVSALRRDIERRKQRYVNILHKKMEWKKRAEAAERERDELKDVNRELYSNSMTVAATLHRVRSELEYKCSDAHLDRINESIRLQAIALSDSANQLRQQISRGE